MSSDLSSLSAHSSTQGSDPSLILMFGWMDARPSYLKKYSDKYAKLYPESAQILITSTSRWYFQSQNARERSMLFFLKKLEQTGIFANNSPRVLMHVFSNGGACSLVDLATVIKASTIVATNASHSAIIFDSAPGGGTLLSTNRSFAAGIRNPIIKCFWMGITTVFYFILLVYRMIARKDHPFHDMLIALNKPDLLPWTSIKTPRLYVYGPRDKIVEEDVVEEHALKAQMAGFSVKMERFLRSSHVAHMREDPERYWKAVQDLWSSSTNN